MEFKQLIHERYSCRKLEASPVPKEKLDAILDAAICAPTAVNYQPFRLWVITSEEAVAKLYETTPCTFGAKTFIVVGADAGNAWNRTFDGKSFAVVDASIVATHIMLAIHNEGLGSTWVGKFDAPKMKELFPEMADYELVAVFPIGYPAPDAVPSERHEKRKPADEIVKRL